MYKEKREKYKVKNNKTKLPLRISFNKIHIV